MPSQKYEETLVIFLEPQGWIRFTLHQFTIIHHSFRTVFCFSGIIANYVWNKLQSFWGGCIIQIHKKNPSQNGHETDGLNH